MPRRRQSWSSSTTKADELLQRTFFGAATAARVLHDLRGAAGAPAVVYGRGDAQVHMATRRTTRITPPDGTRALVVSAFERVMPELAEHFGRAVTRCDEPQFLHYVIGDYFVAHQDGNTPMVYDDTRFRLISAVVFLNDDYSGGELVIHAGQTRTGLKPPAGTLVAFGAETTHEVVPVTAGERYTIATWYR